MKKNYWSLFVCLAMFASTFTLTSCDKDEVGSASNLIGTWEFIRAEGWGEDPDSNMGERVYFEYDDGGDFNAVVFRNDGTSSWYEEYPNSNGYVEHYDYEFKNNKIFLSEDDDEIFNVLKLTSSELVFELSISEYYDGKTYKQYYKWTLKKMRNQESD